MAAKGACDRSASRSPATMVGAGDTVTLSLNRYDTGRRCQAQCGTRRMRTTNRWLKHLGPGLIMAAAVVAMFVSG